ncbi:MAG: hypothetical protein ABWY62_04715 [Acidimicrobiia bacterium]
MDTTSPDQISPDDAPGAPEPEAMLDELAGVDPADAPVVADRLAEELERRLDAAS